LRDGARSSGYGAKGGYQRRFHRRRSNEELHEQLTPRSGHGQGIAWHEHSRGRQGRPSAVVEAAALAEWEAECGAYAIRRFARHNRVQAIVSRIDDVDDNAAIGVFFPSIALSPGRAVTHGHGGHPSTGHSSAAYPPPPPRPARHHVSMRQMLPTAPTPPPPTSMDGLISAAKTFLASGALTKSQESPAFTSAFPQ